MFLLAATKSRPVFWDFTAPLKVLWYVLAGISENLGNVNSLPAVLAAWSPDLLFAMAGSYLLLRAPT